MIQIGLMVLGLYYLVKLPLLLRMTADQLGLGAEDFNRWQQLRRLSYYWMIATGWGSALVVVVLRFMVDQAFLQAFGTIDPQEASGPPQLLVTVLERAIIVVGVLMMYRGWGKSRVCSERAKALSPAGA